MASDIKIVYHNNVFAGSGAPADGDLLTRDNSSHPKDSVYIDRDSGTVYVRKDTTLVAATDWQASSGGTTGGGTALESYQNSAMSAPVQAYVYRDADDNIFEVYEPLNNNRISRYSYTYAESIDVFPFDSANVFNNHIEDTKLLGLVSDTKIQSCKWKNLVVKNNTHTATEFINHNHIGKYGSLNTTNGAEIYISGNGVKFYNNQFGVATLIDSPGAGSIFKDITAKEESYINCNGYITNIRYGIINAQATIWATADGGGLFDFYLGASAYVDLGASEFMFMHISEGASFGNTSSDTPFIGASSIRIGPNASIKPATAGISIYASTFGSDFTMVISEDTNYLTISSFPTFADDPTNIPASHGGVYKNDTTGEVKYWVNDGGTLKSITFA